METLLKTRPSPEPNTKHQDPPLPQPKSPRDVASDSGDRRLTRPAPRQLQPEQLPCPRCDSTKTKFCYYNNYNLSQPRHFCKSCRRYWTRGGALRNVPVGGGARRASSSNKRPRIATATAAAAAGDTSSNSNNHLVSCSSNNDVMGSQTRALEPVVSEPVAVVAKSGSTSCWWSSAEMGGLPFNGYSVGLGIGAVEDGLMDWPMEQVSGGGDGGAVMVAGEPSGCSTWQIGGDEGGMCEAEADYISWPDLTISAPSKALK